MSSTTAAELKEFLERAPERRAMLMGFIQDFETRLSRIHRDLRDHLTMEQEAQEALKKMEGGHA